MNHNIFLELMSTPYGGLYVGVCLTIGALASALSIGYYTIFRYPALLYFACSVTMSYLIFGLASQNPARVLDVQNLPQHFYLQQTLVLFGFFFFYKMVATSFHPHTRLIFPRHTFPILTAVVLGIKLTAMLFPSVALLRTGSFFGILFLVYSTMVAMRYPAKTMAMRLIKFGCAIPAVTILVYPLARLGVISANAMETHIPALLMGAISLHAALWFLGLVELAREAREREKINSREHMARTLTHLRDLMETPLDEIQGSVAQLNDDFTGRPMSSVLKQMDSSVNRLRLIKAVLSRFEKNAGARKLDEDTGS